jgi:hypothetical protein
MSGKSSSNGRGRGAGAPPPPEPSEEDPVVKGPLVFFCRECKTIIGDSFAFVGASEEMDMITLSAVSNVVRLRNDKGGVKQKTSTEGPDTGSSYVVLLCKECQDEEIGRYYNATTGQVDLMRNNYSFHTEKISSYELGTSQRGSLQSVDVSSEKKMTDEASNDTEGFCKGCIILTKEVAKVGGRSDCCCCNCNVWCFLK